MKSYLSMICLFVAISLVFSAEFLTEKENIIEQSRNLQSKANSRILQITTTTCSTTGIPCWCEENVLQVKDGYAYHTNPLCGINNGEGGLCAGCYGSVSVGYCGYFLLNFVNINLFLFKMLFLIFVLLF